MLIAFHCFSIFIFQLWRNRKRLKIEEEGCKICRQSEARHELRFDPPVYRQRYGAVYEILLDQRWRSRIKKLVDFGCAEFGLFIYVKRLNLNDVFFVDIREDLLRENLGRLRPLIADSIKRKSERFDLTVFTGSVSDPDYRLHKTDCVTAIELIEHLYPDVLEAFSYNILGYIQPKILIVTTPNFDFNVIFDSVAKFRHYDHKFEWTRQQFKDWATNLTERYPDYIVELSGIGEGPASEINLGRCSQLAVFIHKKALDENYVSSLYSQACACSSSSDCKGVTVYAKLKCRCLCPLCQPNTSVGICTYYSYSKQIISYEMWDCKDFNPAYNIYYKLIERIQYPFEVDPRTEEERMLDTFRYRINNLYGRPTSRFYVEDRERCEIPLKDILYGREDLQISESELSKALQKFGYTIEDCRVEDSQRCESCVVFAPEMDDYSSTSETASGYDSECAKFQQNDDSLSDWDDSSGCVKAELQSSPTKDSKPNVPTTETEDEKRQQDSLFDSGYQKSLSLLDDSPQTPLDVEETDVFDDTFAVSDDSNRTSKKTGFSNKRPIDPNKINELDAFTDIPPLPFPLKLQPEATAASFRKAVKESVPGPSNVSAKKKRKAKKVESDDGPLADAKSVADTIIENTLNKIDAEDENEIMRIGEKEMRRQVVEAEAEEEEEEDENIDRRREEEGGAAVENGDLANNNRDLEGNNYAAREVDEGVDFVNDNLEDLRNVAFENNNEEDAIVERDDPEPDLLVIEEEPVVLNDAVPVVGDPPNHGDNTEPPEEVSFASREVLFDPNSEEDLLEDIEMPPPIHDSEMLQNYSQDVVFFDFGQAEEATGTAERFPGWLLQILGTQISVDGSVEEEEEGADGARAHDEPHFYCQGDGLGVHPSVVAVEIDQDEADDETTTTSTTPSAVSNFAEAEQEPSEEASSLPEESQQSDAPAAEDGRGPPRDA